MRVLLQRLSHLRNVNPMLLRGSDSGNLVHWKALTKRKYSTPSVACVNLEKTLRIHAVNPPVINNKNDNGPERIQENVYAHNFFLNSWKYAKTVMRPSTTYAYVTNKEALEILKQDWNSMTSDETVSAVKKLSYNFRHNNEEKIESSRYTKAFSGIKTENMTDDELVTIMQHLVPFNNHMKNHSFYTNLCMQIERECMRRFLKLPIEKTLYLCDIIYQITCNINKYFSQYIWYSIRKKGNRPHQLSPQQLIQILFFLNIHRKPPINMYEFEYQLEQCKEELSINELAIAALGFFKTSTKIRSANFLEYIIRRSIADITEIHSVSIASIIKLVRYSVDLTELKPLLDLLKILSSYEPHYTLASLTHIAQTCGRVALYNQELMDRIIGRLNKELKTARLKDFERLLYTFSILNINSGNSVYQNVIEELRTTWNTTRASEIQRFPHVASRILGYMTIQNIYPIDLIKYVMAPEFVTRTCQGDYHFLSREYLVLDYSLRIEIPEYDGPFLKPTVRIFLEKKYFDLCQKTNLSSSRANLLFSEVLATCQELFNNTTDISIIRPLPYFTPQDIVLCLNEQNQLVPSKEYLSQFEEVDIKRVDKENSNNVRWIALILGHPGLLIRNCRDKPTGALAAKMRQLSIIGYMPVMVSYSTWNMLQSQQEKCDYIKSLISK
ncbi:PREDICTED: FAST kinase domain-containing protein 5, mitochondrial [Cyphomyrmex costatus]|uniref:FAST kinase domain-containing protein 5 n=1 Tax=Cyphomyrmex costatus TaxID=456900 RepID=A0A195D1P1_9HYME|nr:PREDICTED: FAST kinase domain-containing protein 5, mitochondrial [Cyphomyrmex costatus]KYN06823.1 FAST kinase domain-containing protein 5 [Cyphomyrmex costatus]